MKQKVFICIIGILFSQFLSLAQDVSQGAPGGSVPTGALTTNQAHEIIRRLYREILHREPDRSGLQTFTQHLSGSGKNEAWLRKVLLQSPERKTLAARRIKSLARFCGGLGLSLAILAAFGILFRRYRSLRVWALKLVGVLLVTLLLAEISFRMYHHIRPLYFFYDDSYNRFRGRPFAVDWGFRLNSKGFQDLEYSKAKTSAYRVLGIGDSFAFGVVPYKYNYHTRLEEMLRAGGMDVEVINMGIPSTGIVDYLNLLVREGVDLDPDMVIVSLFTGNDFTYGLDRQAERRRWYDYSLVVSFMHYLTRVRPHYEGWLPHVAQVYDDHAPRFSEEAFLDIECNNSCVCQAGNDRFRRGLAKALVLLAEMHKICINRNIIFVVAIIPDELQLNGNLQRDIIAKMGASTGSNTWDWSQPNRVLAEELVKMGIAHIDLYPPFREASGRQSLYKLRDTHWNIAGNELAAQILSKYVALALPPSATNAMTKGPATDATGLSKREPSDGR